MTTDVLPDRVKYPRTPHLPWSEKVTDDDRVIRNLNGFIDKDIIITIKFDGENTTLYKDYLHARSVYYSFHPSRSWIKFKHAEIAHEIPKGWRICGENLFAKHTIEYKNLEDYFLVFSIWNDENICLSWKETVEWCDLLGLKTVPVIHSGKWDENFVRNFRLDSYNEDRCEGYVVRIADRFAYKDFSRYMAKCVYENFKITPHKHWMHSKIVVNKIKNE